MRVSWSVEESRSRRIYVVQDPSERWRFAGVCADVVQDPSECWRRWQSVERGVCADVVQDSTERWQALGVRADIVQDATECRETVHGRVYRRVGRRDSLDVGGCVESTPSHETMDEAHKSSHGARARIDSPVLIQRPALELQQPPQHPFPRRVSLDARDADDLVGLLRQSAETVRTSDLDVARACQCK